MKKLSIFMSVIMIFAIIFTACNKEGVYNPKQKISKIYTQYSEEGELSTKELDETWTWDGNLLAKIAYGDDGNEYEIFEYDGKQISKITNYYDGEKTGYLSFTYDKSMLQQIDCYDGSTLSTTAVITHDKKTISKVVITDKNTYEETEIKSLNQRGNIFRLMSLFFPGRSINLIAKNLHKSNDFVYTIDYTYDGNNIILEKYTDEYSVATVTFTYDNKLSPYYQFIGDPEAIASSENNMLTVEQKVTEEGETFTFSGAFTYEYDGKWPTKAIATYDDFGYSFSDITYYEYVK